MNWAQWGIRILYFLLLLFCAMMHDWFLFFWNAVLIIFWEWRWTWEKGDGDV